jgi:hypothetical protein
VVGPEPVIFLVNEDNSWVEVQLLVVLVNYRVERFECLEFYLVCESVDFNYHPLYC